jgi:hypothetical protein
VNHVLKPLSSRDYFSGLLVVNNLFWRNPAAKFDTHNVFAKFIHYGCTLPSFPLLQIPLSRAAPNRGKTVGAGQSSEQGRIGHQAF